jgi:elongation factor Ts
MSITAQDINKLRQATGAGMLDCRKALTESNGDFEAAIDWLRKQGQKVAAKRSDRETKEGVIVAQTNSDNTKGVIVCLSCETDFVAKNDDFVAFAKELANIALNSGSKTLEEVSALTMGAGTVQDKVDEQVAKIGEKINLSRFETVEANFVMDYIHGNYRMGVLVGYSEAVEAGAAKDIAMQVAAMNPLAVDEKGISAETVAREKAVVIETMKADPKMADKPEEMLEKIAAGKMGAFLKENTLLAQMFVKDGSKTVADFLKSVNAKASINEFKRVQLG